MKGIGAGVGLISILLAAGLIFYMTWGGPGNPGYVRPALEAKRDTEKMANAISGRDEKGQAVTDSITYEATAKGILIKTVVPGGALDVKFGLNPGDLITELGPLTVDQFSGSDATARDYMQAQYARPDSWTIRRGNQRLSLPQDRNVGITPVPTPTPAPAGSDPSAQPNQNPPEQRTNPRKQANDLMKKIEQH